MEKYGERIKLFSFFKKHAKWLIIGYLSFGLPHKVLESNQNGLKERVVLLRAENVIDPFHEICLTGKKVQELELNKLESQNDSLNQAICETGRMPERPDPRFNYKVIYEKIVYCLS